MNENINWTKHKEDLIEKGKSLNQVELNKVILTLDNYRNGIILSVDLPNREVILLYIEGLMEIYKTLKTTNNF